MSFINENTYAEKICHHHPKSNYSCVHIPLITKIQTFYWRDKAKSGKNSEISLNEHKHKRFPFLTRKTVFPLSIKGCSYSFLHNTQN